MTDQKAAGEVTREHKVAALVALRIDPRDRVGWLDKGHEADKYDRDAVMVARSIAEAEARGRAEACCQRDPLRIAGLERALATLQARYDTLVATHALSIAPGEELTEVEVHNAEAVRLLRVLGGVVFTRHMGGESNVVAIAKWLDNDALLLAARAKGDG